MNNTFPPVGDTFRAMSDTIPAITEHPHPERSDTVAVPREALEFLAMAVERARDEPLPDDDIERYGHAIGVATALIDQATLFGLDLS